MSLPPKTLEENSPQRDMIKVTTDKSMQVQVTLFTPFSAIFPAITIKSLSK